MVSTDVVRGKRERATRASPRPVAGSTSRRAMLAWAWPVRAAALISAGPRARLNFTMTSPST